MTKPKQREVVILATISTRPIFKPAKGWGWQAHYGSQPVGPVRALHGAAIDDLPPAANASVNNAGSYNCNEPYRACPVPVGSYLERHYSSQFEPL